MYRIVYYLIFVSTCLPIMCMDSQGCCSNLLQRAGQAKMFAIDRLGYWKTVYTTTPDSYTYSHTVPEKSQTDLRFMTFNIQRVNPATRRWYHLFQGGNPWFAPHRLWRILDIMKHFNPDVMCLQEMHRGMVLGILSSLPHKYTVAETNKLPFEGTLTNPIIYNQNRCKLLDLQFFNDEDKQNNEITYACMNDMINKQQFVCMNIHAQPDTTIYDNLNKHASGPRAEGKPCYIAGDFNWPIGGAEERLEGMQSACDCTIGTFSPWYSDVPQGRSIDSIFYNPASGMQVRSSNVIIFDSAIVNDKLKKYHRPSDHRPVIADFYKN